MPSHKSDGLTNVDVVAEETIVDRVVFLGVVFVQEIFNIFLAQRRRQLLIKYSLKLSSLNKWKPSVKLWKM